MTTIAARFARHRTALTFAVRCLRYTDNVSLVGLVPVLHALGAIAVVDRCMNQSGDPAGQAETAMSEPVAGLLQVV